MIKIYAQQDDEDRKQDQEGEKAYQEYITAIAEAKDNIQNRTKEISKQRVLGSCITGLAKYFDTSTVNEDNFASDFDINTQDGFSIDKGDPADGEDGNDILYINGNIKGNSVGFYYNLDNPDAELKSDDFLSFDDVTNSFAFKEGSGGKSGLGVKLPTIGFLTGEAQSVIDNEFSQEIEKAGSMEDFEEAIKEKISKQLLKNYGQEAIVKTRVERDIEKNITTQTLQDTFFPDAVLAELNKEGKNINDINDKKVRKLLDIRDETTENMRSDELRRFRSLITRLDPIITEKAEKPQENLEPKRQKLLEGMDEER
jgi:hypothetical protein